MILYFSGTGNSRYAANLINSVINDEIVSLNDIIKNGDPAVFTSETPYVIVCPVYAWRMPRIIENLIKKAEFNGSNEMYFVLTCGNGGGNAYKYAKELCGRINMTFKGLKSVVMPENYIAMFKAPQKEEAEIIIKKAEPKIISIANTIKEGGILQEKITPLGKFLSNIVNPYFYNKAVSADGFYYTDECISCGKCAEVCPLNNISVKDGKPVWGTSCTHCMACICLCPKEAIEYKNRTQSKVRYHI